MSLDIHDIPKPPHPTPITEPCHSCGARCCNRFAVPITGFDLVRILEKLKCDPNEFAQLAFAQNIETCPHAYVFIFHKGKLEERLLSLHRLKNNYCVFSRHSAGCAIWGYHPMVCKTYPFGHNPDGQIKYVKNFACPRDWERGEFDEKHVLTLVEQQEMEIAEYNKIVRSWNALKSKNSDEKAFWKYLIRKSKLHAIMRKANAQSKI